MREREREKQREMVWSSTLTGKLFPRTNKCVEQLKHPEKPIGWDKGGTNESVVPGPGGVAPKIWVPITLCVLSRGAFR